MALVPSRPGINYSESAMPVRNDNSEIRPASFGARKLFRRCVRIYVGRSQRLCMRVPVSVRKSLLVGTYARHLHRLVSSYAERKQSFGTYFLRNRAELQLLRSLLDQKAYRSRLNICVLACSRGAEVYSSLWTIRSARPDLRVTLTAVDISSDIVEFAEEGVYSLK